MYSVYTLVPLDGTMQHWSYVGSGSETCFHKPRVALFIFPEDDHPTSVARLMQGALH